jgi:class 3 adenylate cyclase/tetratricopeptide (TPR) repeat protein
MTGGPSSPEARKVVTVLFADIRGSTGLGQDLDPESLQNLLSRFFGEMRRVVERHEGLVEKFIGDAVMAVFGLPRVHEDDAVRAVRAAAEMREALAALNEEFVATWGITVAMRTGVNTGEVLARERGAGQSIVVGDAVNVAARLEQVAAPGEILIGEATYRLVRGAVTAQAVGPLTLKGKSAPVPAWRLADVVKDAPGWARRLDSPLVGRERELAALEAAFRRAADERTCQLVTVMGAAGVGKSRLTAELLAQLGSQATVLHGRCLPYGEGITFWPMVSILMGAVGIEDRDPESVARRKLSELLGRDGKADGDTEFVCDALAPLIGFGTEKGIQETYWAIRKLFERLGERGSLVVALDDIHWAEPTLLDLVEYLADWIRSVPVLLVCQARPELLDTRPGWVGARDNASLIALAPLSGAQTDGLIRELVGGIDLPAEARARIATVAEGNPLFVEETLRMLVDHGVLRSDNGRWVVTGDLSSVTLPPTIHALLTARLDRLEPDQRGIIERGATVGRSFWWGAVAELSPPEVRPRVGACLQSLVRKDLLEPDRSEIRQEDAFRFTHILVRDAAYQGIPKAARASMHERLAEWIDVKTRDLAGEYEEIVGYHLEQAYRSLIELGPPNDHARSLAVRAATRLAAAGERAFARGDMPAAVNLLRRASALLEPRDPRRLELLPEIAFALMETADFDRLVGVAVEIDEAVSETGDAGLRANASVVALWIRLFTEPEGWAAEAERVAGRAISSFDELGDERGLARAWSLLGLVQTMYARFGPAEEAWSRAAGHADRAGHRREALESLCWVPLAIAAGPTSAEEGIRRCREVFDRARGDRKVMSSALFSQADFEAGLGHFEEARTLLARARALLEEVALPVWSAGPLAQETGWIELLAGAPAAAETALRRGYDVLSAIGEVSWLSTNAGILAEALYARGAYDEAERFTRISEENAGAEDMYTHVLWRSVRAKVLARRKDTAEALRLADAAARLADTTDYMHLRWHELMCRAETFQLTGRTADADAAARAAIRIADEKGNLVGARLAREALDGLLNVRTTRG